MPISLKILENLENRWLGWAGYRRREVVRIMGQSPRSLDFNNRPYNIL